MPDKIQLEVNGRLFDGWKSLNITEAMEQLSGKFDFSLYDKEDTASRFIRAGSACRLYIVDGLTGARINVLKGYVDKTKQKLSGKSSEMSISGRDRTGDVVDCSAVHRSNTWLNARFSTICKDLVAPYGLLVDKVDLLEDNRIERFTLQNGESSFSAIERLCMDQGVLPDHTIDGDLKLTYTAPESKRAAEDLEAGVNILEVEKEDKWNQRYSNYVVKGQGTNKGRAWTGKNTRLFASAEDLSITRNRPFLFMSENRATADNLVRRVAWEAQVRAGRGTTYKVKVKDWFQKDRNGTNVRPWSINERVYLTVTRWDVFNQLLITGVNRKLDESSSRVTVLTLKHPETYKANPSQKVKLS